MPKLQIDQHPGSGPDRHRVEVRTEGIPGFQTQSISTEITFALSAQERERIRWYLEDFLQFDQDPAPKIAKRVEQLMRAKGESLYRAIFEGSPASVKLWAMVEPHLSSTRVEVATGIAEATAIPWELIRDPNTGTSLALSAEAFVRTQRNVQAALATQQAEAEKVRILLVICRPKGGEDVPFRSVAGRLATRLGDAARDAFALDVLRPPTYERLAETLRLAKDARRPYHIVHFDGHGTYADPANLAEAGKVLSNLKLDAGAAGRHGFLLFEDPDGESRSEFVDGSRLGALLRDSGVPLLVLNACQSAFADPPADPEQATAKDGREEVEAYGSLAQAVVETGAAGVVAMRYSVYVVTAARFVAELYGALARGRSLGEAVSWARKNLADEPERQIAYEARALQDWSVPVVWERTPVRLWPETPDAAPIRVRLDDGGASKPGALDLALPASPDIGFFGRDETLYALDRAFDAHRIVLLHAYAGSGKTATAAEFARWYALTGGVQGPVLFSTFERHLTLARLLDKIGEVFGPALQRAGVQWDAITDAAARRDHALQVLQQVPVLWIWDNVEPVTGFPAGTESDWSREEQQELRGFLSAARETQAKFLLTSRRDEQAWLGELARRVHVPPMPMQERLQLAGAIALNRGKRLVDLPDLRPLLRFTRGNPLTILITVREALRAGIATGRGLRALLSSLEIGEVDFGDEAAEGRATALSASLAYGFGHAFKKEQRKVLGLLHLFQGFVDANALCVMGHPDAEWCLDGLRGLTLKEAKALLDRAAEIGLLSAMGGGFYAIHPALPWFFYDRFRLDYPAAGGEDQLALRAFVEAMAVLSRQHVENCRDACAWVLRKLATEEDNLLAAWRIAQIERWWSSLIQIARGLFTLYEANGRRSAQRRLVGALMPDFVGTDDGPLPNREDYWSTVTTYRIDLAQAERQWQEAERLQRICIDWDRKRARSAVEECPEKRSPDQLNDIRNLAISLGDLGRIQTEQSKAECLDSLREAFDLAEAIGDADLQPTVAFRLGTAYGQLAKLRDLAEAERWLAEAERWLKYSLKTRKAGDALGRGRTLAQLGVTAHQRVIAAIVAGGGMDQVSQHIDKAVYYCKQAQALLPKTALVDIGHIRINLGVIYNAKGHFDHALRHYYESIRHFEDAGDLHAAGLARYNAAIALLNSGRREDARAYVQAALSNFLALGDHNVSDIENARALLAFVLSPDAASPELPVDGIRAGCWTRRPATDSTVLS